MDDKRDWRGEQNWINKAIDNDMRNKFEKAFSPEEIIKRRKDQWETNKNGKKNT